ncbi:MAG: hypothetical protein IT306_17905 [Chloroflexi bacterium]|nr:hypothetical protein [Chloroflexota bacterium]
MTQQTPARRGSSPVQRGRLALASALAAFTMFGGAAFADEPAPAPELSIVDAIAFDLPTDVAAPTVLKREKEQRGNDDGPRHARQERRGGNDSAVHARHRADDLSIGDQLMARRGADDRPGDDRGKDNRGSDNQPGDDHGGHGHGQDDAPNHG